MEKIIDIHTHLGDILHSKGGELIEKNGVKKKLIFDPITLWQIPLNRNFGLGNLHYRLLLPWVVNAEQVRNATATRENARRDMDRYGITYSACLPIAPNVLFSDLKEANEKDPRLIPFTTVDFSCIESVEEKLSEDVENGAKGLKLHTIIQQVSFSDTRTHHAVDVFSKFDLPILFHAGISNYFKGGEKSKNSPEFGRLVDAIKLVKSFPTARFIVGHAGMFEVNEVIDGLGSCSNVWVDTSMQSPKMIRKLIEVFGENKVLFASDWPFCSRKPAIRAAKKACRGDKRLEQKIFFENAADLIRLND